MLGIDGLALGVGYGEVEAGTTELQVIMVIQLHMTGFANYSMGPVTLVTKIN